MRKKKKPVRSHIRMKNLLSGFLVLSGILCACYPFIANYVNQRYVSRAAGQYEEKTAKLDEKEKKEQLEEARKYNEALRSSNIALTDPFASELVENQNQLEDILKSYDEILNMGIAGKSVENADQKAEKARENSESVDWVMGFVEVPCVDILLPIYHGCSEGVLEKGAGHLQGSSLPVGGKSTHCVLAAHTGLHRAKMFTDLHEMQEGDHFYLHVLGDTYAYEVDQMKVVLPEETEDLLIVEGKDLVTLLTCTPYGVNDHRLLVRGHRVKEDSPTKSKDEKKRESIWMEKYKKILIWGGLLVFLISALSFIRSKVQVGRRNWSMKR